MGQRHRLLRRSHTWVSVLLTQSLLLPDPVTFAQDGRPEPGEAEAGVGAAGAARTEVCELAAVGHAHKLYRITLI